jgi:hypothetical protein
MVCASWSILLGSAFPGELHPAIPGSALERRVGGHGTGVANPSADNRAGATWNRVISALRTAWARRVDSARFDFGDPMLSVFPSIVTDQLGFAASRSTTSCSAGSDAGTSSALL